jgi:GNAT superfamily N-acetyltransferase
MTEPQFILAGKEDIPQINQLVNRAYRGDESRQGWTTEADFLDGIRVDEEGLDDMLNSPCAVIMLAKNGERTEGCVFLQKQERDLYLGMLTVDPALQARGLGKKLLNKAEEWALSQGCNRITMTVITLRNELIAWYERNGYIQTNEKKPFPDDPRFGIPKQSLEFVVMQKHLK